MGHLLEKATRQHTRDHNTRLVFQTIYDNGEISRAELARLTRLTRTTVSNVVGDLLERGLVEEVGTGQFSGGRLPILLRVVEDSRYVLALRLDTAELAGALISLRGAIRRRVALPFARGDVSTLVEQLCRMVDTLAAPVERPLLGIGLSMPGVVDTTRGVVCRAVNFGLTDVPLRDLLQAHYRLPVYLGNEVHLRAMAEYAFGAGSPTGSLITISAGIGIGAGIVLRGELVHGDSYGAGEIGHVVVDERGLPCNCGNTGCLETVASTYAIICKARDYARQDSAARLHRFAPDLETLDLLAIRRALEDGDPGVAEIVAEAGRYLGQAIASAVGLLNIERVVLTGPIAVLGRPFRDAVAAEVSRRVLSSLAEATRVELLPESVDAVLLGASALLLRHELGLVRVAVRRATTPGAGIRAGDGTFALAEPPR